MSTGILVHEWIERSGGAERVFDSMVDTFPEADMLCLWNDAVDRYPGRRVQETWMSKTPLRRKKAAAVPFMPLAWRRRNGGEYDWALISSHLFAHHVSFNRQSTDFKKFVYVHSPARYLWAPEVDARAAGILPRLAGPALRTLDRRRASEPYAIAANSNYVKDRIRASWDREAEVIYPPVEVRKIQDTAHWCQHLDGPDRALFESLPTSFVLGASRFVRYKNLDLVIKAGEAAGLPVVLAGGGPEEAMLRAQAALASVPVIFLSRPSDALMYALFQAAVVYVFPAVEDFGIMPVEAMAAGARVVGCRSGGVTETVIDGMTGVLCDFDDTSALARAVDTASRLGPAASRARARRFSADVFSAQLRGWVSAGLPGETWAQPSVSLPMMTSIPSQRPPVSDGQRTGTKQ